MSLMTLPEKDIDGDMDVPLLLMMGTMTNWVAPCQSLAFISLFL